MHVFTVLNHRYVTGGNSGSQSIWSSGSICALSHIAAPWAHAASGKICPYLELQACNAAPQILSFLTTDGCCPLPSATVALPCGSSTTARDPPYAAFSSSPSEHSTSCGSMRARNYSVQATAKVQVVFQPSICFLRLETGPMITSLIRLPASAARALCVAARLLLWAFATAESRCATCECVPPSRKETQFTAAACERLWRHRTAAGWQVAEATVTFKCWIPCS